MSQRFASTCADLVRPTARADDPVSHGDVGAVLVLRHACTARLLHDAAVDDRAGKGVPHLRRLHGDFILHAIFGGIIADRWLGNRRAVIIGGTIMAMGHFLMTFDSLLYVALATIALGNGLFLPSLPSQINDLYAPHDPRRARAYNIYYVGINLGGFLAPLVCGTLGEFYGWHGVLRQPESACSWG